MGLTFVLEHDDGSLETGTDFELLAVLGNNRRVEENRVESAEELVVDLDPLDAKVVRDARRRVGVLGRQSPEGCVDELLHLLVDDRDPDTLEADPEREGRDDVDVDCFVDALSTARDRLLTREGFGVATVELEDAVGLGVVEESNGLSRPFRAHVDRQHSALIPVLQRRTVSLNSPERGMRRTGNRNGT